MTSRAASILLIVAAAGVIGTSVPSAATFPHDDNAIAHVLNRMAFGPAPGDIERVRTIGLERYIDDQLHPERLLDAAMPSRLAQLTTIGMSTAQISEKFEQPQLALRRERKAVGNAADSNEKPTPEMMAAQQKANAVLVELGEQKMLRAVYSERQLQEVLDRLLVQPLQRRHPERAASGSCSPSTSATSIRPHVLGKFRDLLGRRRKSPAMLFYLDNWQSADPNGPHR